jgi:antitoxin Phd
VCHGLTASALAYSGNKYKIAKMFKSNISAMMAPAVLTFRNSRGDFVDVPSVAATRAKNEFGVVLEQALRGGAVAITRHDAPKAVLISYEEFKALIRDRTPSLNDLHAEYDALLANMQTPKARKGMDAAFNATPVALGKAAVKSAVKAARKRR